MKFLNKRMVLIFIFGILVGVLFIHLTQNQTKDAYATNESYYKYKEIEIFTDVLSLIKDNYVEPVEIKKLIYGAAKGMVGELDPFSQFMDPDIYKMFKSEAKGSFGGLGIKIAIRDKQLTVITPLPGTPAFRMGILPDDKIIKIEGESTQNITVMEAVNKLRGKKGTNVTITILREGVEEPIDFTITRDIIKIQSISSKMLDNSIGYIQMKEFSENTVREFDQAWKRLEKDGMRSIIIDLRNNPGGLLTAAADICKRLVADQKLIVYTQGRDEQQTIKFFSNQNKIFPEIPLVVLVNKGSASGSEIVAGCVQDWRRGVILGQKTFGKGSVQTMIPLSDGSGLRITTAKYYTPLGRTIHEKGIIPDITVEISREDMIKLMQQSEKIYTLEEGKVQESEQKDIESIEDVQLTRAKEILVAKDILKD